MSTHKEIERDVVKAALERAANQLTEDMRSVMATDEGRRVLHWIVYTLGGLQAIVPPEQSGKRVVATAVYMMMDQVEPGSPEEIALEARKQRIRDDAEIKSAIAERMRIEDV